MMRRLSIALFTLCVCCGDDGPVGASTTTGSYTLRTINGAPLPYTITSGSEAGRTIVGDVITLYQGGTFAEEILFRGSAGGAVEPRTLTGTFVLFGTSITLRINETGRERIAQGDGTTMTFIDNGMTSVYTK